MKRRAEQNDELDYPRKSKRQAVGNEDQFREGLFDQRVLEEYRKNYTDSKPYRHGIIPDLISPMLLREVRSEIQNLSFTPKETDIYKIHQSGDLANLDSLDDASLNLLPSLLTLRNAMYSSAFRRYLSQITDSGPLSGRKTDMAINVYTPGCHLLCHDDVIGSRRLSYILYLTDPDKLWKEEWGGALRLYPTQEYTEEDGQSTKVPSPDHTISITPAFNQLSYFAVQPGKSFHDVEEVYAETENETEGKDGRVRMAISGWYHIPQQGEEGYVDGLEEQLSEKSSLMQLQGKADKYDLPQSRVELYEQNTAAGNGLPTPASSQNLSLSEVELDFLLKYIAPTYLTPDTLESVSNIFAEECSLCLDTFLSKKFSDSVRDYIQAQEQQTLPTISADIENSSAWTVARPPHKHRFLFQQVDSYKEAESPLLDLVQDLLPSTAFRKWLFLATGHQITSHSSLLRRFRRGKDYTLATGYYENSPRIELSLVITPTPGWSSDQSAESKEPTDQESSSNKGDGAHHDDSTAEDPGVGGYLAYMAGEDEEDTTDDEAGSNHIIQFPFGVSTGARSFKDNNPKKKKQDPAVYQASGDDEDDGILFSMPAGWNRLGIVLRDKGSMRFVKYVSQMAKGDRWDVVGEFGIADVEDDEEEEEGSEGDGGDTSPDAEVDDDDDGDDDNDSDD